MARARVRPPTIEVSVGQVPLQLDGFGEVCNSLVVVVHATIGNPAVDVRGRVIRCQANGLRGRFNSQFRRPLPVTGCNGLFKLLINVYGFLLRPRRRKTRNHDYDY